MKRALTYDDVLLVPQWSEINSRKDVDLRTWIDNRAYTLPVLAANMDTVCGVEMAKTMHTCGGAGCLHRFWSIEDNVKAFINTDKMAWGSFGLGETEFERACALVAAGCKNLVLDIAHGAQKQAADQYAKVKEKFGFSIFLIAGNFGSLSSVVKFQEYLDVKYDVLLDGVKLGVGPGANCETRVKTGHGYPQWSLIKEVAYNKSTQLFIIADGGIKTAGDIAKAIGAGASMVMLGSMLAGTDESPGEIMGTKQVVDFLGNKLVQEYTDFTKAYKILRGSASAESYKDQGKTQDYIAAEGISAKIPYKGSVVTILKDIEGGLRSALCYSGAWTLDDFHNKAEFVEITSAGAIEGSAHIKKV